MPIDTRIEGDPESIRAAARWLHGSLAERVRDCATQVFRARDDSEWAWLGDAGAAFRQKMATGGTKADELGGDAERAGRAFDAYADQLQTAQAGMKRAREIAVGAGLQLDGDQIIEPGPGPTVAALPADAAPAEVAAYNDGMAAVQAHAAKVKAFGQAAEEAGVARGVIETAAAVLKNLLNDLGDKPLLTAADLVNSGIVAGYLAAHVSALEEHARWLAGEKAKADLRYLGARGGSPDSKFYIKEAQRLADEADTTSLRAASAGRRIGSKIPVVGVAVTAAGIGYDIHGAVGSDAKTVWDSVF